MTLGSVTIVAYLMNRDTDYSPCVESDLVNITLRSISHFVSQILNSTIMLVTPMMVIHHVEVYIRVVNLTTPLSHHR